MSEQIPQTARVPSARAEKKTMAPVSAYQDIAQSRHQFSGYGGIQVNQGQDFKYWLVGDWVQNSLMQ